MTTVRISRKAALFLQALVADKERTGDWRAEPQRYVDELRAALRPRVRKALPFPSTAKTKRQKKETKKEETGVIRAAVMERAGNRCECGCGTPFVGDNWRSYANEAELDHFFGRVRVKQSVASTWALTRACHIRKTKNSPSAAVWLGAFIRHCLRYGYTAEAKQAKALLFKANAKAEMSRGVSP